MPQPSASPKIMVVEDDSLIRETLRLYLELEGYSVVDAQDGKAALGKIPPAPDRLEELAPQPKKRPTSA